MKSETTQTHLPYSKVFVPKDYTLKNIHNRFIQKLEFRVGKTLSVQDEKWIMYILLKVVYPAHAGQFRDEGPPYIIHPIEVAIEALDHNENAEVICAALLHDTLEDTYLKNMSRKQLIKKFHSKMLEFHTELLSKIRKNKLLPPEDYINNLKKDPVTIRVKAYDRIVNLRSSGRMVTSQPRRVQMKIKETRERIIPLVMEENMEISKKLEKITNQLEIRLNFASEKLYSKSIFERITYFLQGIFFPRKLISLYGNA